MDTLNYHHLHYFWVVVREGGLVAAAKALRLSHPTLSAQIHALEDRLGEKLFAKVGRKLALTDVGRVTFRYADEIFTLGRDLVDAVAGRNPDKLLSLDVGVVDVLPKMVVRRLLKPALDLVQPVRLVCREGDFERLLGALAQHDLDIVIGDSPVPSGSAIRAHNHLLGESAVGFYAAPSLAKAFRAGFPGSLDDAPMLLPTQGVTLRRSLNQWFDRHGIRPHVVAEFQDSALLKVFGAEGLGVFPAPKTVSEDLRIRYQVAYLGDADGVIERFYAISAERRIKHPAVVAIAQAARHEVFGATPPARPSSRARTGPRPGST
ncbi:MAG: transcriptional activator NhaR [Deltaproteobacteria bacterium]|nr:transcriptional activator NhaR [Deltaproteobacteria bacterium]